MALTFAVVATLAAVGGGWAVRANEAGRWAALALLALFGLALVFPCAVRSRDAAVGRAGLAGCPSAAIEESICSSLVLGVATGLLWAPCAGPILGIIFTAAAIQGATLGTTLLLLAYALGAATSLALALLVGGKVYRADEGLAPCDRVGPPRYLACWSSRACWRSRSGSTRACWPSCRARRPARSKPASRGSSGWAERKQTEAKVGAGGRLELPVEGQLPSLDAARSVDQQRRR